MKNGFSIFKNTLPRKLAFFLTILLVWSYQLLRGFLITSPLQERNIVHFLDLRKPD